VASLAHKLVAQNKTGLALASQPGG